MQASSSFASQGGQVMTDLSKKPRKPYPRVRKPRKTAFTSAIWVQWMVVKGWLTPSPDERTLHLRAGIAEFRHRLRSISYVEAQP
jgi:hypothetical protein